MRLGEVQQEALEEVRREGREEPDLEEVRREGREEPDLEEVRREASTPSEDLPLTP